MQRQSHPKPVPKPMILLTRAQEASERFAALLTLAMPDVEVIIAPLQEVRFVDWTRPDPLADVLIFTSRNAVVAAARAGLGGLAYCVGDQTAQAAQLAGFRTISAAGDAQDLVARVLMDGPRPVWHLRGREARGNVAPQLRAAGFNVTERVVYDMVSLPLSGTAKSALRGPGPVLVLLFSPKSAKRAAKALAGAKATLAIFSISEAVDDVAKGLEARARWVALRPDADGMLEIVVQVLNSGALP
jgi:uroporphyrinogen-III synthase